VELIVGHSHAVGSARTGEADEVLGADVGGKNRRADDEPAEVAARKEVIVGRVLAFSDDPPDMAKYVPMTIQSQVPSVAWPRIWSVATRVPFKSVSELLLR
jgi:hypothetical protein